MIHLPIIIVATAFRAWTSVVVILVVVVSVKVVLTKVVIGREMILLLQQWSYVVVIILLREVSEVSETRKRIQHVSLVAREEVLRVEVVVHKGLHRMLLPRSVPYFRIEIPIEVHFVDFI